MQKYSDWKRNRIEHNCFCQPREQYQWPLFVITQSNYNMRLGNLPWLSKYEKLSYKTLLNTKEDNENCRHTDVAGHCVAHRGRWAHSHTGKKQKKPNDICEKTPTDLSQAIGVEPLKLLHTIYVEEISVNNHKMISSTHVFQNHLQGLANKKLLLLDG